MPEKMGKEKVYSILYRNLKRVNFLNDIVRMLGEDIYFRNMKRILIYPFFECNFKCPYCVIQQLDFKGKMKKHSAEKWVKVLNKLEPSFICISGGEPFNWPNRGLKTFLEKIDKKHAISLLTNLSWRTEEHLPYLKKANKRLKKLFISPSFHPYGIDVDTFIKKMKILEDNGFLLSTSIVAYPSLLNKLSHYKKRFAEANIPFTIHSYITPNFKYTKEQVKSLGKVGVFKLRSFEYNPKLKKCGAGVRYVLIVPNGDCYTCHSSFYCVNSKLHRKYKVEKEKFYLGNIFDGTFSFKKNETVCNLPCSEMCDIFWAKPKLLK